MKKGFAQIPRDNLENDEKQAKMTKMKRRVLAKTTISGKKRLLNPISRCGKAPFEPKRSFSMPWNAVFHTT